MQARLSAAGLTLKWRVEDLPPKSDLGPSSVLATLRILQEAVTNTLKHGRATTIVIAARDLGAGRGGEIVISDDGRGFELPESGAGGHGLRGMRKRAADSGIDLGIESAVGKGTRVVMRFPPAGPR